MKPITESEICDAVREAIRVRPIHYHHTHEERNWQVRARLLTFANYLGEGRPDLLAALRELGGLPQACDLPVGWKP